MLKKRGFTLIELLVVVLIIGILTAIALPQYSKAVEKSRSTEALLLGDSIHKGVTLYYLRNEEYPSSLEELDIEVDPSALKYFDVTFEGSYPRWKFRLRRLDKGFSSFSNGYYEFTYVYGSDGNLTSRYCTGYPCRQLVNETGTTSSGMTMF